VFFINELISFAFIWEKPDLENSLQIAENLINSSIRVCHQAIGFKTVEHGRPPWMAEVRATQEQLPLTRRSYRDVFLRF
jgi:hypothetical protein